MTKTIDASAEALAGVSAGAIEQLWVLWTGFHDGADYARRHPAETPYLDADRVMTDAAMACERKLHAHVTLDPAIVHPAYTYGWMAGYLAELRNRENAVDGLSLGNVASGAMNAQTMY